MSHVLAILRELVSYEPRERGTSLEGALRFLTGTQKKRVTAFLLSDFMDDVAGFEDALKIAARKHDLVGVRVWDRREAELVDVGLVDMVDAETGGRRWLDTSSRSVRREWRESWERRGQEVERALRRSRVDSVTVDTSEDYVKALIRLFRNRGKVR